MWVMSNKTDDDLASPEFTSIDLPNGGGILWLVRVPAGVYEMGSENELPFAIETPVHTVSIASPFFIGKLPVTQRQYEALMKANPSAFRDSPDLPVENVTWFDANIFCRRLTEITDRLICLPSEAKWEYACRAGSFTDYHFGETAKSLDEYAWYDGNSHERTHPAGLKNPNAWGLQDIVGNVWEWCEDEWHGSYEGAPQDGSAWVSNQQRCGRRCVRGGAWDMDAFRCRSSYRSFDWEDAATNRLGFRIVIPIV